MGPPIVRSCGLLSLTLGPRKKNSRQLAPAGTCVSFAFCYTFHEPHVPRNRLTLIYVVPERVPTWPSSKWVERSHKEDRRRAAHLLSAKLQTIPFRDAAQTSPPG